MIGKLSGIIDFLDTGHLIIDVSGVGYVVQASSRTLSRIGQAGDAVSLRIETQVREDSITLFGFMDAAEQGWFKLLTSVQGVGAKVGLAILSVCPPEKLSIAIAAQDKAPIRQADGVGPKLATRILTELKDKAAKMAITATHSPVSYQDIQGEGGGAAESTSNPSASDVNHDAVSALLNLGYARSDAYAAVMNAAHKANDNERENLQVLIKLALKELAG